MLLEAVQYGLDEAQPLLKTLICESECTTLKHFSTHSPGDENKQGKKRGSLFTERTGFVVMFGDADLW